ncbi:MAG: TIR domain-containing protein [Pelodictyon phaeoclathratiforme]
MSDIFISYAREDVERVKPIVQELEKNGWSVFWDRNLRPGSRWAIEITKALDDSRCVLVVWSSASINAVKHHWVREEAETGRERGILVPLCLDAVVLPLGFRSIQAADLSNWNKNSDDPEFQQLIAAINEIIPLPDKLSSPQVSPSTAISVSPAVPVPSPASRATSASLKGKAVALQQPAVPKAFTIGDKYGGGKVAFIDATGQHGLIAAEADLPGGNKYTWNAAKKACKELKENGYNDWFLPSKEELNQLYHNRSAVGGFAFGIYWSSTEYAADVAWNQVFGNGSQRYNVKGSEWRVRPVRAF